MVIIVTRALARAPANRPAGGENRPRRRHGGGGAFSEPAAAAVAVCRVAGDFLLRESGRGVGGCFGCFVV